MDNNTVIKVENLYKKFCRALKRSMFYGSVDLVKSMCGFSYSRNYLRTDEFWALENINFELKKGESLGLIGLNGSGKSTLLRVLNGIYPPDAGRVTIRGNIGALIAVGAGFHPHMTGRENIFLNGAILGMSKKEILEKFDSIVEFSDIGEFMDAPVSTYSSGMYVRLGFSIAIHSEPEILLIDEVLSVGDLSFQNKCLRKIFELKQKGTAIIFVSHSLDSVRIVCDRIILMNKGNIIFDGDKDSAIMKYNSIVRQLKLSSMEKEVHRNEEKSLVRSDVVDFIDIGIMDCNHSVTKKIRFGENFIVYFDFFVKADIDYPSVAIGIKEERMFNIIYAYSLNYKNIKIPPFKKGNKYRIQVLFKKPNIKPGVYGFNSVVINAKTEELYLHVLSQKIDGFEVVESRISNFVVDADMYVNNAVIELESDWKCEILG